MSEATERALDAAIRDHMQDQAPGAVLTEWVMSAAGQKFNADGTNTHANCIEQSDATPTHRIQGLLEHAQTRYRAHVMALQWSDDDDDEDDD